MRACVLFNCVSLTCNAVIVHVCLVTPFLAPSYLLFHVNKQIMLSVSGDIKSKLYINY